MKKAFFQLHLAILFAGFTAIFGKLIELNEGMLVLYRMLLSGLVLGIMMVLKKQWPLISLAETMKIFGVGAIVALHWVFFYGSIKYSNISVAVTCLSAIGFFTSLFEPLIYRRKADGTEVMLGLLAIAGVYLIFNFYPEYQNGIIFGILSAIFASLFPIFNKRLLDEASPETLTLYEMAGGFLLLCIVVPFYIRFFPAGNIVPTASDWIWLLILSIVCTVISFILQLRSLKFISAFTANLSYNLEPIYSIILAFAIFGENKFLGTGFYLGLTLIVLAVVLQMMREWQKRKMRVS